MLEPKKGAISRPPIKDPFAFIHAGGLQGEPITFSRGLSEA